MCGGFHICVTRMEEVCELLKQPNTIISSHCCLLKITAKVLFLGVFFIPYVVFLFACGIPLFLMEIALGQYTSQGSITCWRKICPLFEGKQHISVENDLLYIIVMYLCC